MNAEQLKIIETKPEFIVKIKKSCESTGVQEGQIYKAKRYWLDSSKVTLLQRLTDKSRKPIGKSPDCNEYLNNVEILL